MIGEEWTRAELIGRVIGLPLGVLILGVTIPLLTGEPHDGFVSLVHDCIKPIAALAPPAGIPIMSTPSKP